jgi:hypothetical protein
LHFDVVEEMSQHRRRAVVSDRVAEHRLSDGADLLGRIEAMTLKR